MHKSIATIASPEFINLQSMEINPLMSSCEIKVCYLGENRNRSYISKETATKMAKTLRGAPIVGYYKQPKEDFADHGELVTVDDEGIHFDCLTKPYGFVSPDAKVWFQTFDDIDDFGNVITRTYLMTTGYLWTGQFEECKSVIENGKNQSMELDDKTLDGKWATNNNSGIEFFIINDATFSKLCILGDDVEPCFEGARVTKPEVSASFSLDNEFKTTLYQMMQELHFALKGGQTEMETEILDKNEETIVSEFENNTEEVVTETVSETEEAPVVEFSEEDGNEEPATTEEESVEENEEEEGIEPMMDLMPTEPTEILIPTPEEITENDETTEDSKKKIFELETELEALKTTISELQSENASLKEFKAQIEEKEKDEKIAEFYMLDDSDEDKQKIIAEKSKYTVDEIESKLATLCFKKQINFINKSEEVEEKAPVTFNLNDVRETSLPAWLEYVEKNK